MNSDCCEKQARRLRSTSLSDFEWSPASRCDQNDTSHNVNYDQSANGSLYADGEKLQGGSESVSSTDDMLANAGDKESAKVIQDNKTETQAHTQEFSIEKTRRKVSLMPIFGLLPFVLLALFILLNWMSDPDEFDGHYLVPT